MDLIRRDTSIEDLVDVLPQSIEYPLGKGIHVIVCGEPIWRTLEEVAKGKGYTDPQIDGILADLSARLAARETASATPLGSPAMSMHEPGRKHPTALPEVSHASGGRPRGFRPRP